MDIENIINNLDATIYKQPNWFIRWGTVYILLACLAFLGSSYFIRYRREYQGFLIFHEPTISSWNVQKNNKIYYVDLYLYNKDNQHEINFHKDSIIILNVCRKLTEYMPIKVKIVNLENNCLERESYYRCQVISFPPLQRAYLSTVYRSGVQCKYLTNEYTVWSLIMKK